MTPPPVVAFRSVSKSFGGPPALDAVSFDIAPGECVALLGPSGCGKTTTLRILAGFETPDAGAVAIGGREMRRVPPFERPIGLVFQDYALFPHMSVAENVDYGMKRRGVPKAERATRRAEMLDLVRLGGLEARRPAQLSGGQQQRVALARALATRPALLLLDEPLSNLDARLRHDLRQELRAILKTAGTTTLMVTHDQEEALAMADRIVLMNAGRVEQIGTPEAIYARPATRFAANFLGRCNWLDGAWIGGSEAPPGHDTPQPPHAEVAGAAGPRSTQDGGASFEAPLRSAPQDEECGGRIAAGSLVFQTASAAGRGPIGLAIRPERVRLAGPASAAANRFPAKVAAARFLGPDVALGLDLGGCRLEASLKADGRPIPAPGEACIVEIDPEACVAVPVGASP